MKLFSFKIGININKSIFNINSLFKFISSIYMFFPYKMLYFIKNLKFYLQNIFYYSFQSAMGCSPSIFQSNYGTELTVATLNYSGILLSPYEFYENEDKFEKCLSLKMKQEIIGFKVKKGNKFKFQFGPFDKKWQDRFSPLYLPICGVKNNSFMMSEQEFLREWESWKNQNINRIISYFEDFMKQQKEKKRQKQKKLKEQKQNEHQFKQKHNRSQQKKNSHLKSLKGTENQNVVKQKKEKKDKNDKNEKNEKNEQAQVVKDKQYFLNNLKYFDLLCYKSILFEVYKDSLQFGQLLQNFSNQSKFQLSSKKYLEHRKKQFMKPFLNEDDKIQKTIKAFKNLKLDILFLQQATEKLIVQLQSTTDQFLIVRSHKQYAQKMQLQSNSVIIIRKSRFPKIRSLLQQNRRFSDILKLRKKQLQQKIHNEIQEQDLRITQPPAQIQEQQAQKLLQIPKLNLNKDTVIQIIYNLILICPHLSSKKQKQEAQIEELKKIIIFFKNNFPDCHIIVGGDLNCNWFTSFQFSNKFNEEVTVNVVPDCTRHLTVHKKRTSLQVQQKKAEEESKQTKDYIISDLEIRQAKIITIDNKLIIDCKKAQERGQRKLFQQPNFGVKNYDVPLLPSFQHPYDHYVVYARLVLKENQRLEHITDKEYLFKYRPEDLSIEELEQLYQYQQQLDKSRIKKKQISTL